MGSQRALHTAARAVFSKRRSDRVLFPLKFSSEVALLSHYDQSPRCGPTTALYVRSSLLSDRTSPCSLKLGGRASSRVHCVPCLQHSSVALPQGLLWVELWPLKEMRCRSAPGPQNVPWFEHRVFTEVKLKVTAFSRVRLFVTPLTVAHQAPPSMGFSSQEHWSEWPFPPPGIFPTQGSNPGLPHCRQTLHPLNHQGSYYRGDHI